MKSPRFFYTQISPKPPSDDFSLYIKGITIGRETYGGSARQYLFGSKPIFLFRIFHVSVTFIGFVIFAQVLWDAADFCSGVMCIPNLFFLILFAGIIAKDTRKIH